MLHSKQQKHCFRRPDGDFAFENPLFDDMDAEINDR
jgi:hypothetical protein